MEKWAGAMSEPTILKPAKVTLWWRRYGDDIEWKASFELIKPDGAPQWPEDWDHESERDGIAPLQRALFKLGCKTEQRKIYASPLSIVELPKLRDPPKIGNVYDTGGEFHEDGLDLHFCGACPVQGIGSLDGRTCYYRARGRRWSFSVWPQGAESLNDELPICSEEWSHGNSDYCAFPDAGWIHRDETLKNLREALAAWRSR